MILVIQNPWYIPTLVSFTAGNRPEAVPHLFKYVLGELERVQNQLKVPEIEANREKVLLVRRFRDAIFKCGITGGYSKVYVLLSQTNQRRDELPPDNKRHDLSSRGYARGTTRYGNTEVSDIEYAHRLSDKFCRDTSVSLSELERQGDGFFRALYGETADNVQGLLNKGYPDVGTHTMLFETQTEF